MNFEPRKEMIIMRYDFLPLIKHSFAYGTEHIIPEFIISSKAKETLIYPKSFSLLKTAYDYYTEGSNQEFYEIRYILEGEGYLKYNGKSYLLKKGDGCLIDCRQKYYYQTSSYHWVSTSLYFDGTPAAPLVQSYLQSGNVKFSNTEFLNFEPFQTHILQCTQKAAPYMEYEISATFYLLLTNLLIVRSKTRSTTSDIVEKIVSYMQANYMKNLSLDDLSHHFGLSRTHMSRCFKEYTGFAPHEYITRLRIYNAKYLLKATELSIEEISHQTGFSDSVYFIQVFKKMEGITPSKFRKG